MDRIDWKYSDTNIKILTLGVIYDGMAFPVLYYDEQEGELQYRGENRNCEPLLGKATGGCSKS